MLDSPTRNPERLNEIRFEEHHVGSCLICLVMRPLDPGREIVFRSHVVSCRLPGWWSLALSGRCSPCADQADAALALSVRHDEQAASTRQANAQKPLLIDGMVRIADGHFQRIAENSHRLAEFNAMLGRVLVAFAGSHSNCTV